MQVEAEAPSSFIIPYDQYRYKMRGISKTGSMLLLFISLFFALLFMYSDFAEAQYRFELTPAISLNALYDDNIDSGATDEESDLITTISPSISLDVLYEEGHINLTYSPTIVQYRHEDQNNSLRHEGRLGISRGLSRVLNFNFTDSFLLSEDPIEGSGSTISIRDSRDQYQRNTARINFDYLFGQEDQISLGCSHSLLKNEGFPSACEKDLSALLSMAVMMYVSNKPAYMGNPNLDLENNIISLHHSDSPTRMFGFDQPSDYYEIKSFAVDGFGVNLRYDYDAHKGQEVTLSRFDPSGRKILLIPGEISGGNGMEGYGCSQTVHVAVNNSRESMRAMQEFGHHLTLVYGHCVEQIRDLVAKTRRRGGLIAHTLVSSTLRGEVSSLANEAGVVSVDLIGPLITSLSNFLTASPAQKPPAGTTIWSAAEAAK